MHKIISMLMVLVVISACTTFKAETPAQRYYALKSDYERVLITAIAYKQNCTPKPETDSCHNHVAKIRHINQSIRSSFKTADRLGLQSTNNKLDAALIAASTGLQELSIYLFEVQ